MDQKEMILSRFFGKNSSELMELSSINIVIVV